MREFIRKVLEWLFGSYTEPEKTPFDDYAHAGEFHGKVLSQLQIQALRLATIISAVDCILTDVSRWQLVIDFVKMAAAGIKGTILKCGQGLGLDPFFVENWRKAKAAGLKRGSYWYYDSRVHPLQQAKLWAEALAGDLGELVHFADYEETYMGSYRGIEQFKIFLAEFQRLTKLPSDRIGVYTGYYYWIANGSVDPWWSQFWLWIAWYGPAENVLIPRPWTMAKVWAWQYTASGNGPLFGVQSQEIDMNYYVMGLADFEQRYGEVIEIPTGDNMETGLFEVWSDVYAMSLRSGAYVAAPKVGLSLPRGTRVKADQIMPPEFGGLAGDKWARVIERDGTELSTPLFMAIIHNGVTYCNYEKIVVDDRPNPTVSLEFTDRDGKVWTIEGEMSERA